MFTLIFVTALFIVFIQFYRVRSVSFIFILLLLLSAIGSILIGKTPCFVSPIDVINIIYVITVICLLGSGFAKYSSISSVVVGNPNKFRFFSNVIIWSSIFSIIVNCIALYFVLMVVEDFGQFKQGGESTSDFYYTQVPIPHSFISLSSIISAFSYFALPLHFYYLMIGDKKKALLSLFASTALIFSGLLYFSRSSIIHFVLLYISFLLLFYKSFSLKMKKLLKKSILFFAGGVFFIFASISINRFDDKYSFYMSKDSLIQNELLYSLFDYGCMWFNDGFFLMRGYGFEPLGGILSNTLYNWLFGGVDTTLIRQTIWPEDLWATFNGLFCIWLFDFGYLGTLILSLIICIISKRMQPVKGKISIISLYSFPLLFSLPLMSFSGNYLEVLSFHFAVVFLFLYKLFLIKK